MKLVILSDLLNIKLDTIFVMCLKCEVHSNNRQIHSRKKKKENKKKEKRKVWIPSRKNWIWGWCRASGPICQSQRVLLQVRKGCLKEARLQGGCPEAKVLTHLMGSGSCFHTYSQRKNELKQEKRKKKKVTKYIYLKEEVNKRSEGKRSHILFIL